MFTHVTILRTVFGTSSKVIKTKKTEDLHRYKKKSILPLVFRVLRWLHENCGDWGGELIVKDIFVMWMQGYKVNIIIVTCSNKREKEYSSLWK